MWQRDSHESWEFTTGGSIVIYYNERVEETGSYSIVNNTISLKFSDNYVEKYTIVNLDQLYLELDSDHGERVVLRRT